MTLAQDLAELRAALEAETEALLAGEPHETAAARKALIVHALERRGDARAGPELHEDLRDLRAVAHRNASVLGGHGRAARILLRDLTERMARLEDDGIYRRGDLDGTQSDGPHPGHAAAMPRGGARALPAPSASRGTAP